MARRIYKRRGMTMSFEVKARQCECKVESAECKMVRGWKFTARGTNHGIRGIHSAASRNQMEHRGPGRMTNDKPVRIRDEPLRGRGTNDKANPKAQMTKQPKICTGCENSDAK